MDLEYWIWWCVRGYFEYFLPLGFTIYLLIVNSDTIYIHYENIFNFFAKADPFVAIKFLIDCNFTGASMLTNELYYFCSVKKPWLYGKFRRNGLQILISVWLAKIVSYAYLYDIALTFENMFVLVKIASSTMYIWRHWDHSNLMSKIAEYKEYEICLNCHEKFKEKNLDLEPKYCKCVCQKHARLSKDCSFCQVIQLMGYRFDSCITGSGDTLPWLLNLSYGFILFLDVYVSRDEKSYLSFFKKQEDSIVYIVNNTLLFANVIGGLMLISFLIRILIIIHLTIKAALKQDALNQNNKKTETESKPNLQSLEQNESEKNEVCCKVENEEETSEHFCLGQALHEICVQIDKIQSTISKFEQAQSEKIDKLMNQQTKSEIEIKNMKKQLDSNLETQLDSKLENLSVEIKRTQTQHYADLKNQQKLFLQQLQNNPKRKEFLVSNFSEISSKLDKLEKHHESVKKQCNNIQTALNNNTKQQNLLQNLVLDLKSEDIRSEESKEKNAQNSPEVIRECKICMDKPMSNIALRPCGHIVFCEDCVQNLPRNCPVCRKMIIDTLKIWHT